MTLNNKLNSIKTALTSIEGLDVFHYFHYREQLPYCIWAEDFETGILMADNKKQNQSIEGTVELFTKTEFDPFADAIQEALEQVEGLVWKLNSVQFEEYLGIIHHEWLWRIR